ncbi:MAG: DUF5627 domain-containing protein [Balneolales bacterium]
MKKILIALIVIVGVSSCKNFDNEFDDYNYTSAYFPYQYPVRTLIMGDYIYDNSNDNDQKFVISATMGGVYTNDKDRSFEIEVDESLTEDIMFSEGGDEIQALPSEYYNLSSSSELVIPKGEYSGGIEVELTDQFFDDPEAIKLEYVVPIRLVNSTDVDSILSGKSVLDNPDVRNAALWEVQPKNFTMFAVKFINELHGTYFHYGENTVNMADGTEETNTYTEEFVANNNTSNLVTTGKNQVTLTYFLNSDAMQGEKTIVLDYNGDDITISEPQGSSYTVTGSGEFQSKEYSWGNKDRDGIVLNFTITENGNTYEADDVLVARDRAVKMETYAPFVN